MMSAHGLSAIAPANGTVATIVLENLTHGFHKPCILDVKLGTVLYDEDAPPEKKERMIRTAASTTSLSTGIRLTGFQVYANDHPDPVLTPKKYGKTITPEHLPDGIARFFPFRNLTSSTPVPPFIPAPNIPSSEEVVTTPDNIQPGLPLRLLFILLTRLLEALERLRVAVAAAEVRIVGGSILVIYEGDWARAEKAARMLEGERRNGLGRRRRGHERGHFILDDVVASSPVAESLKKLTMKTRMKRTNCACPDTGVLLGIDTIIRLIRERQECCSSVGP
ncbi:hypothetical protein EDC04DRAFT_2657852 [Pisolithus marmoratus]|nr:hypothetical protein EDC04DRAFT_2657852 [Pisolithus marmoratus]